MRGRHGILLAMLMGMAASGPAPVVLIEPMPPVDVPRRRARPRPRPPGKRRSSVPLDLGPRVWAADGGEVLQGAPGGHAQARADEAGHL